MATKKNTKAAAKPAPKSASKKPSYQVGDVVVFKKYAEEQDDPLLVEGEYVRITEDRGVGKNGQQKYAVEPLESEDDEGNERDGDTVYLAEIRALKGDEQEEVDTILAQESDEDEDEDEDEDAEDEDEESEDEDEDSEDEDEDEDAEDEDEDEESEDEDEDEDSEDEDEDEDAEDADEEDEDEDEESEDLSAEDIESLGADADGGDQDAADKLTDLANEHGLDPNDASEYPDWATLASAINDALADSDEDAEDEDEESEDEDEAPAKGKGKLKGGKAGKAGKASSKKTGKKAAKANSLQLTDSVKEALEEFGEDALAAAKQIETDIESKFMTLGGVIAFGMKTNAHLAVVDKKTKKPLYQKGRKGFFEWVKDNLSTEARTARHLAKIYTELVAKHGVDEERLQGIGITKLREIVGVANQENLEGLLQLCEQDGLTVRDIITHVRNDYRQGGGGGSGGEARKVVRLDFRLFEDRAATANVIIDHALKQLPEAQRNKDEAFFSILTEYANAVGIKLPKVKKAAKTEEKPSKKKADEKPSKKAAAKPAPKKKSKA